MLSDESKKNLLGNKAMESKFEKGYYENSYDIYNISPHGAEWFKLPCNTINYLHEAKITFAEHKLLQIIHPSLRYSRCLGLGLKYPGTTTT